MLCNLCNDQNAMVWTKYVAERDTMQIKLKNKVLNREIGWTYL